MINRLIVSAPVTAAGNNLLFSGWHPAQSIQRWLDKRVRDVSVDVVGWGRLSPDHHCRKCMAMRSQEHGITQGFTATGSNRNSLKVFFVFVALTYWHWVLDCWCLNIWYHCTESVFGVEMSSNHLSHVRKPLIYCYSSTSTVFVTHAVDCFCVNKTPSVIQSETEVNL